MRHEQMPVDIDGESTGYTFFFQIAHNGGRQACGVEVKASNSQEATTIFRQNWPAIESMARDGIHTRTLDERVIKLVMT
jgi:hypothetical protein